MLLDLNNTQIQIACQQYICKEFNINSKNNEVRFKLFNIREPEEARKRWTAWFKAAKESGIKALVHFAELKEKRIEGLISHAVHPISTGKLEGLNNKIKVAKRIGYGYRNDDYFFTLVRYIAIPRNYVLMPST